MTPDANAIADCVLEAFDQLPEKRKPRSRNDASREWVPLAGIVMCKGNYPVAFRTERSYSCLYSYLVKAADFHVYLWGKQESDSMDVEQCRLEYGRVHSDVVGIGAKS